MANEKKKIVWVISLRCRSARATVSLAVLSSTTAPQTAPSGVRSLLVRLPGGLARMQARTHAGNQLCTGRYR